MKTKNLDFLCKQFQESMGFQKIDLKSSDFKQDFFDWLIERMKLSEDYLYLLDNMNLSYEGLDNVEIGKGPFDSVFADRIESTIITPLSSEFDNISNPLIEGRLLVFRKSLVLVNEIDNLKKIKFINSNNYSKLMTQNPYNNKDICDWENIHNSKTLDIIFGMFGFINDKDRKDKLSKLFDLKDKLDDDTYKMEYTTVGHGYFAAIGSEHNESYDRIKVLRRY